jgi:hypothetical protein
LPLVFRLGGDGDEEIDDADAERNCGFSYAKLIFDRFEPRIVFLRDFFPFTVVKAE